MADFEGLQCGEAKSLSQTQSPIAWDCGAQCWVSAVVGSRGRETESRDVPYCSPVCVEELGRQQTQPGRCWVSRPTINLHVHSAIPTPNILFEYVSYYQFPGTVIPVAPSCRTMGFLPPPRPSGSSLSHPRGSSLSGCSICPLHSPLQGSAPLALLCLYHCGLCHIGPAAPCILLQLDAHALKLRRGAGFSK